MKVLNAADRHGATVSAHSKNTSRVIIFSDPWTWAEAEEMDPADSPDRSELALLGAAIGRPKSSRSRSECGWLRCARKSLLFFLANVRSDFDRAVPISSGM